MLSCGLSVAQSSLSPDYSFAGKLIGAKRLLRMYSAGWFDS